MREQTLMLLRLFMFLRRERGNATSKARTSNTTARRTLGDYQRKMKQSRSFYRTSWVTYLPTVVLLPGQQWVGPDHQ